MDFWDSVGRVLPVMVVMGLGFALGGLGVIEEPSLDLMAKLVVRFSLPLGMLQSLSSRFTREELASQGLVLTVPFLSMLVCYGVSSLLAGLLRVPRCRRGLVAGAFSFSNSIFLGLPLARAMLGEEALPFALIYYMGNTTLWWTLGFWGIARDCGRSSSSLAVKGLLSPPLVGFLAGLSMVLLGLRLPAFLDRAFAAVGQMTTPLSLVYVGSSLWFGRKGLTLPVKELALVSTGRFLFAPALTFALSAWAGASPLASDVFVLMAGMPVLVNLALVARMCRADERLASALVVATTALSVISMPIAGIILGLRRSI